ncbi:MAG: BON domain-containing protein [Syntrophales bacterium]|jgi:hyperosmotically inducible periplasmic protein
MKKCGVILCYFAVLIFVSGCASIFSGAYGVAQEERSSKSIYTDEKIKITIDKRILDEKINVFDYATFCYNGDVYLIGEYETAEQKEKVLTIAHSVTGVKSVKTYLLPKRKVDNCGQMDQAAISIKVQALLIEDHDIHSTNIDVKVVQCHVILLGIVGTGSEADKAVALARSVEGVRDVTSFLKSMR